MNAEATRVRYIVVGIGINVNQASFPKDLPATSLRLVTGSEWSRVDLVAALLKSLDREYRQLLEDPDARQSILRRFAEKSSWVQGKAVRIEENGAAFEGTTEGLDPRGFLQVRTAKGTQTVLSGTVRETVAPEVPPASREPALSRRRASRPRRRVARQTPERFSQKLAARS